MKRNYFYVCVLVFSLIKTNAFSQSVAINEDNSAPNPNAILDVKSFNKGILIPRLSSSGRIAIPNTKGLLVYDTTTNTFWFNTGTAWQNMAASSGGGSGWSLTGNSGTTSANFLGTTDDVPFIIKVNNAQSGRIQTGFIENTYWGYSAGVNSNDSARHNTGIGSFTLNANTIGSSNVAVGARSLFQNINGNSNTAIGIFSLKANTSGSFNTSSGAFSLSLNTTGGFNTSIGYNTMPSNTSGTSNTAVGVNALLSNTIGTANTAIGENSLQSNTTGSINIGIGPLALFSNSTGLYNVGIGSQAMYFNESGILNTAIGSFSDVPFNSNFTNATAIGASAVVNASNKVRIGNSAVTVIEGQVPFTTPSDGRFKWKVQEDVKGLDFIMQLRPVTYLFDTKRFDEQLRSNRNTNRDTLISGTNTPGLLAAATVLQAAYDEASSIRRSGFIAQEVEKAANASGYNFSGLVKPKTEQDHYSLSYESFVVPLVKAIQEQQQIILDLQKQINELKQQQHNAK